MSSYTYPINLPKLYTDLQDMRYEHSATHDTITVHILPSFNQSITTEWIGVPDTGTTLASLNLRSGENIRQ